MHNVEQLSAASKVAVAEADSDGETRLKILSERVGARAALEAEIEAYWINRIRTSVRGYRRSVLGLVFVLLIFAGWAGAVTALAWDRLEGVAIVAFDEVRSAATLIDLETKIVRAIQR